MSVWVTRPGCHVDRVGCAWLVRRFIDRDATFVFVDDIDDAPAGAVAFDMRGAVLSHRDGNCSFEAFLVDYGLDDPALAAVARIVHEADLADDLYDAPEAAGLDALLRGLSLVASDDEVLAVGGRLFDGLYAYVSRG